MLIVCLCSQSTAGSRSPAPDSQQEQIGPSTSRQGREKDPYVPTSPSHHVEDGYEPGSGHASASAPSRHPNPQPQPESLQRFSSSTGPWNPASPTETPVDPESLKRRYSDVAGMDEYELDRSYPDKLETEYATSSNLYVPGTDSLVSNLAMLIHVVLKY